MKYSKYCLIFLFNLLMAVFILYKITHFALKWADTYTKHGSYVVVPNLRYLTLNQSISILKKLGLKYDVDTSRYDPSFKPSQVLSFFPEAGDHVKRGRHIYIQANYKNLEVVLPNIINKDKRIAIKLIHANHLLVKEIKYVNDVAKNMVLKVFYKGKSIPSGSILPHKDRITLIIGKGYEKNNFMVPNVIGKSLISATSTLKEKLFKIINFYYDHSSMKNKEAIVYRQEPYPGKIHNKNKPIYLWLTYNNNNQTKEEFLENSSIKPYDESNDINENNNKNNEKNDDTHTKKNQTLN